MVNGEGGFFFHSHLEEKLKKMIDRRGSRDGGERDGGEETQGKDGMEEDTESENTS